MNEKEKYTFRFNWNQNCNFAFSSSINLLRDVDDMTKIAYACALASFYSGIHAQKEAYNEQDTGEAIQIFGEELMKKLGEAHRLAALEAVENERKKPMSGN